MDRVPVAVQGMASCPLLQPGRFTELFFLDEATAFAAGHRPCALCRREDYVRFVGIWRTLHPGPAGADAIDARLHRERLGASSRSQRHHEEPFASLPDGAFVVDGGAPFLVLGDALLRWTPSGYTDRHPRPEGLASVVTPASLVDVLRAGWTSDVPILHPSARAGASA
jgi:hypothetical protein